MQKECKLTNPKILFVLTPDRGWHGELLINQFPSRGVGYLAAYLKEQNIKTVVYDTSLDFANRKEGLADVIERCKPVIVGITLYSNLATVGQEIISDIKSISNLPIVAGGPHISVSKEEFLQKADIEYGIMKDGEIPLSNLINALFVERNHERLHQIPGLIFKDKDGNYKSNNNTDLIVDLDKIPFPDFSGFELEKYPMWRNRHYTLTTSRGCPYRCTYCAAPNVTGGTFRFRSPENVVNEIEFYVKKGFKKFDILDDAFNIDLVRAKTVCELIIKRKLGITWELSNGVRANFIDKEFCQLLKKAGCNYMSFGLESGNEYILKKIKKGVKLEQVYKAVELAENEGIGTAVNFIIGHPHETYEMAMETLGLAKKMPSSIVNIFSLMPIKGTEAYGQLKDAEKLGNARFFFEHDYYLSHFSATGNEPVFETSDFTKEQRKKILKIGRNITNRRFLQYRLGRVIGFIAYLLTKNDKLLKLLYRIRTMTSWGEKLYLFLRRQK